MKKKKNDLLTEVELEFMNELWALANHKVSVCQVPTNIKDIKNLAANTRRAACIAARCLCITKLPAAVKSKNKKKTLLTLQPFSSYFCC